MYSSLTSLSTIFQSYHDGVWLRQGAQCFYSAAVLKYHVPDNWHDTTPSYIILTLGRPVLALPRKSECQARSSLYHFLDFGIRASTNFQILEVLNFLPLKFGGSAEKFRKFQFATRFYRNSLIYILLCLCFFLDIFNRTFMSLLWLWLSWVSSLFCFNNFHRRVGCFASVLLVFFFCIYFILFFLFFFFSFKLSSLH